MILAALSERFLREVATYAALPEEDVLFDAHEVLSALRFAHPRLVLGSREEDSPLIASARSINTSLPVLLLSRSMLREWDASWRKSGAGWSRAEDAGRRLAGLIRVSARTPLWIEDVYRILSRATGGPLPPEFRGFSRRILEFPRRYQDLHQVSALAGYSRDALKARFRRRGLPSPSLYVRWLRTIAVAYALGEEGTTTAGAAYRLGYSSGGNLCRSIQGLVGHSTVALRQPIARDRLLLRFAGELLGPSEIRAWQGLEQLFSRRAA